MEKTNLEIEDFEDKKSQGGKRYTRFKTSQGWMSAFDKETIEKLKENEGKEVCVNIAVDEEKGFKNIRKFVGPAEADEKPEVVKIGGSSERKSVKGSAYEKDPVGLSVEVFVALLQADKSESIDASKLMDAAIARIKQAQKAFESF